MNWTRFFLAGLGLPFTLYALLQVLLPWRLRGRRRWLAFAPAPVMAAVLTHALVAQQQGSNLWPIGLLLLSPLALVAVCVLAFWPGGRPAGGGHAPRP